MKLVSFHVSHFLRLKIRPKELKFAMYAIIETGWEELQSELNGWT